MATQFPGVSIANLKASMLGSVTPVAALNGLCQTNVSCLLDLHACHSEFVCIAFNIVRASAIQYAQGSVLLGYNTNKALIPVYCSTYCSKQAVSSVSTNNTHLLVRQDLLQKECVESAYLDVLQANLGIVPQPELCDGNAGAAECVQPEPLTG